MYFQGWNYRKIVFFMSTTLKNQELKGMKSGPNLFILGEASSYKFSIKILVQEKSC